MDLRLTCVLIGGEVSGERRCSRWSHDSQTFGRPLRTPLFPSRRAPTPDRAPGCQGRPEKSFWYP